MDQYFAKPKLDTTDHRSTPTTKVLRSRLKHLDSHPPATESAGYHTTPRIWPGLRLDGNNVHPIQQQLVSLDKRLVIRQQLSVPCIHKRFAPTLGVFLDSSRVDRFERLGKRVGIQTPFELFCLVLVLTGTVLSA
jgi:hypothetical protein